MSELVGKFVLGLETGLDGGSVSILREGREIDFSAGGGNLSRSEDLLAIIEELLKKNGIRKTDIHLIAVSDEPGSLTGIRIGIATARGLGDSLSARVCQVSYLRALAVLSNREGRVFSAISTKRSGIYFGEYEFIGGQCEATGKIIKKNEISQFIETLNTFKNEHLNYVFNEEMYGYLAEYFDRSRDFDQRKICIIKGNSAEILGLWGEKVASDNELN